MEYNCHCGKIKISFFIDWALTCDCLYCVFCREGSFGIMYRTSNSFLFYTNYYEDSRDLDIVSYLPLKKEDKFDDGKIIYKLDKKINSFKDALILFERISENIFFI